MEPQMLDMNDLENPLVEICTLPKFNMEPKNDGLQKASPPFGAIFRFHVELSEGRDF